MTGSSRPESIASRFDRIAESSPERPAIRKAAGSISYGELAGMAHRVRRHLEDLALPEPEPVCILPGEPWCAIAALLGVLATGRTTAILDPTWPPAALARLVSRFGARLVLSDDRKRTLAARLGGEGVQPLLVESIWAGSGAASAAAPVSPDAPAVVIFTSGSTGEPKGVIQTHRNLLHAVDEQARALRLSERDRMPLLFPLSGMAGLMASLRALLNGALLVPFDRDEHGLETIPRWIESERLTLLHSTPPMFRRLGVSARSRSQFSTVERVYLSGEPLIRSDVELFNELFPPTSVLFNNLGSTETSSIRRLRIAHGTSFAAENVPVGAAIEGKEVLLLDEAGTAVASGEVGEIVVRSVHLSPGYWGEESLTAERFSTDPSGDGTRRYRTGDLGRMLPDGSLEYLGRKDHQVKIRGYRIETEGIDAALRALSAVDEAVVVARSAAGADASLIAYVVPSESNGSTISELRRELASRLPEYMVPSRFVILDALPRLPGGKVKRAALPPPESTRPELDTPLLPPESPLERQLASIWESVLGVAPVGVVDRFQELGGDSLRALELVSRVESETGLSLHVERDATVTTVRAMAAALGDDDSGDESDDARQSWNRHRKRMVAAVAGSGWPLLREGTTVALFHPQGGLAPLYWCFNGFGELAALGHALGPDQPLYGLYSGSGVAPGSGPFVRRLGELYAEELVRLQPEGPFFIGGNCRGARVAYEMSAQLRARGRAVAGVCLLESFDPRLYRDTVRATLLYGRESHLALHESFDWGAEGWQEAFDRVPSVHFVHGAHGEFFDPVNVDHLANRVREFLTADRAALESTSKAVADSS